MSAKKPAPPVTNLASLRAKHDPVTVTKAKAEAQFAKLRAKGPEAWQYQVDFMREAGIGQTHINLVVPLYKAHTAEVTEIGKKTSRIVWFHNPKVAAQFRKELAKQAATTEA
jgi:hypothetical protein